MLEEDIIREVDSRVANHKKFRDGVIFVDAIPKSTTGNILGCILGDILKGARREKSKQV